MVRDQGKGLRAVLGVPLRVPDGRWAVELRDPDGSGGGPGGDRAR
ncbi:hypothetical protein ABZ953_24490 [Streptomyces sp. NPDC046465]